MMRAVTNSGSAFGKQNDDAGPRRHQVRTEDERQAETKRSDQPYAAYLLALSEDHSASGPALA